MKQKVWTLDEILQIPLDDVIRDMELLKESKSESQLGLTIADIYYLLFLRTPEKHFDTNFFESLEEEIIRRDVITKWIEYDLRMYPKNFYVLQRCLLLLQLEIRKHGDSPQKQVFLKRIFQAMNQKFASF